MPDDIQDVQKFLNSILLGDKQAPADFVREKPLVYKRIMDLMRFMKDSGVNGNFDAFIKENSEFFSRNIDLVPIVFSFIKEYQHKQGKDISQNTIMLLDKGISATEDLSSTIKNGPFSQNYDFIGVALTLDEAAKNVKHYYEQGKLTLDESITEYEKLLSHREFQVSTPELQTHMLYQAGTAYLARYKNQGNFQDLDSSIILLEKAVSLNPEENNFPNLYHDLGIALREKCIYRTCNTNDILRAAGLIQKASQMPHVSPEMKELYVCNMLDIAFSYPHFYTDEQLVDFVRLHEFMLAILNKNIKPNSFNMLARGYFTLFQRTKHKAHIDKSVNSFRSAIASTGADNPVLSVYINNLAASFHARYEKFNEKDDLEDAVLHYKKALQAGISRGLQIGTALKSSRALISLLFSCYSWQEIKEAYEYAKDASSVLIKAQATRTDKEAWIKDMQGIAAQVAYAFAQLGKPEDAARALEQGSARLLSETLALNHADIEALRDSPQPALYHDFTKARNKYQNAQHIQKPEIQQQALRDALKNLDAVIERIRQVEGFEQFLQPAGFEEIEQAAPLLYLAVTAQGGVGILVQRENAESVHCSAFFLPQLDDTQLRERLNAYLNAYQQRHQDNMAWAMWKARLQALCRWLGEVFLKPVREALPNLKEITLIPLGLLNLLPLHAASDGQRSALDDLRITYAPNARSLNRARRIRESSGDDRLLAIEDPKNNIDYAVYATESLRKVYPQARIVQQARHDAVLRALPEYDILHFYCHGKTNTEQPLQSLLELEDDNLTLKTLLEKGKLNARLTLLCACETGMLADLQRAEEFVSLSTGLLQAGSAAVIASLWSVRDDSTMILISRFYHLWRREQLEPAEALRQAQIWLRDSTPQQRIVFFRELQPEVAVMELEAVLSQDFSHPYHWAGFGVVGV